jgi:isopenicillin-N epimerase
VPAALDYFDSLGPEAVYAHNTALAEAAGTLLATAWGTEAAAGPGFRAGMASVRLPGLEGDRETVLGIAKRLRQEHGIIAGVMSLDGGLWIRVSAQIYNEIGDYQRLADLGKSLAA